MKLINHINNSNNSTNNDNRTTNTISTSNLRGWVFENAAWHFARVFDSLAPLPHNKQQ